MPNRVNLFHADDLGYVCDGTLGNCKSSKEQNLIGKVSELTVIRSHNDYRAPLRIDTIRFISMAVAGIVALLVDINFGWTYSRSQSAVITRTDEGSAKPIVHFSIHLSVTGVK